jgi:hypothetical protein
MWLSLLTICLVIAICLGVVATMSTVNKQGEAFPRLITLLGLRRRQAWAN